MQMKKYPVIYADPPWQYRVYSQKGLGRSAESHSPTMGIDEIRALPVAELAEKDCALFLWVTVPCLLEGLSVLQAWGFQYKTIAFVWIKQNKKADSLFWGMGYWTRSNAEFCILATRGSPKRQSAGVHDPGESSFRHQSYGADEGQRKERCDDLHACRTEIRKLHDRGQTGRKGSCEKAFKEGASGRDDPDRLKAGRTE